MKETTQHQEEGIEDTSTKENMAKTFLQN